MSNRRWWEEEFEEPMSFLCFCIVGAMLGAMIIAKLFGVP